MASVALIGPDGAGKTTLTRMLVGSGLRPFKYIYMGIDVPGSNVALPTTRFVEKLKARLRQDSYSVRGTDPSPRKTRRGAKGVVWATGRLINRMADEWYRQCASWYYQARGFTVVYDRHFVFDFALEVAGDRAEPLDRRLHRWCLAYLYPRPSLVIFLDAPGTLLFARKGELTVEELERRRQAFLRVGRRLSGFVTVDATRPLSDVYSEIVERVMQATAESRTERVGTREALR